MDISILVLTYNSDIRKIYLTLQSVIHQKFDDFEIVVADDGSDYNKFEEVQRFFINNNFTKYQMVSNPQNQGTVKNILSGLECASGKYVKLIGAGDALYDENVLSKIYTYMEDNHCECCFGLIQGYKIDKECNVKKLSYTYPRDVMVYRKNTNTNRILKNLVLYSDNTSGAAILYRKDFCIEYMNKIKNFVRYEEDIFQVLSAVEGRTIELYDDYIVWYEIGEGISTKKKNKFLELLQQDVNRFHTILYENYGDNKYVKKRHRMAPLFKINNIYLRTIFRVFVNPDVVWHLFTYVCQIIKKSHAPKNKRDGFLDKEEFLKSIY